MILIILLKQKICFNIPSSRLDGDFRQNVRVSRNEQKISMCEKGRRTTTRGSEVSKER